jgi:hypothetical protein
MRYVQLEPRPKIVEKSIICDDCDKECINTNIEVKLKFSFHDNNNHYKDLCYNCFEKQIRPQ